MPGDALTEPATGDAGNRPPRLGKRLAIGLALGFAVVVAMLVWGDAGELRRTMGRFDGWVMIPALGLSLVGYGLRYGKWEVYLRALGLPVPRLTSALIFGAGLLMSITPGKLGEVFKSFLLRTWRGIAVRTTAPIVIAERLTDVVALLVLVGLSVLAGAPAGDFGIGIVVVSTALAVGAYAVLRSARISGSLIALAKRMPVIKGLGGAMGDAYASMRQLLGARPLAASTALSLAAWGCESVGSWLILSGFAGHELVSLGQATFVFALGTLAGAVSMLPGGLLAAEGSMIGVLTIGLAWPVEAATAATLLIRFATLWFGVGVGGACLAGLRLVRVSSPSTEGPT